MIPGQGTPLTSELSQKGEKACLMVFECRGCEPIEFAFGNGWKVESVSIYLLPHSYTVVRSAFWRWTFVCRQQVY
jgi:hypothetical protein